MIDERREARPTAYALGEMSPEERASFEAELALDADLRAEVEAIREMASLLEGELSKAAPILPVEAVARIEAEAEREKGGAAASEAKERSRAGEVVPLPERPKRRFFRRAALVATLAVAAAVPLTLVTSRSPSPERAPSPLATAAPAAPAAMATAYASAAGDEAQPLHTGNRHDSFDENPFLRPTNAPRSTFSIDVDTASYSMVRTYLRGGQIPPSGAVRIEEMINYFSYRYDEPEGGAPLRVQLDLGVAPWAPQHRLVRVGVKGKTVKVGHMDGVNLVFLVDTSGSMGEPKKLPLLKQSLRTLVGALGPSDRVALVAYAGSAGLVLPSTPIREKQTVLSAIERIEAGGSTNGGAGIDLAYKVAAEAFMKGGVNRVILATDGDFNVGATSNDALVELIQDKAKTGVFLSVLGFGMGNFNDSLLEKIADKGNGQYAYVDSENEAKRALVDGLGSLVTIAKDVKIQVEFNPAIVEGYRLIGYENRVMAAQDFNDDKKDAGDLGSGHTVTALYEVIPKGDSARGSGDVLTVKLRYKALDGAVSKLIEQALPSREATLASMSPDFKFAAAVASFGMLLRKSKHAGSATFDTAFELARQGAGDDPARREMLDLVRLAKSTSRR